MKKFTSNWFFIFGLASVLTFVLIPEPVLAFGFESKMQNITSQLITTILPLLSILGLVYASILAVTGDANAKGRITTVIVVSLIGFLAPLIIHWLQRVAGGF